MANSDLFPDYPLVLDMEFIEGSTFIYQDGVNSMISDKKILETGLKKNWHVYEAFLLLVSTLEILMIIYGLVIFDFSITKRVVYFSCYIFLLTATVIALIINRKCIKKSNSIEVAVINAIVYDTILIFWSATISALDIDGGGFPVTYMTIIAAVGSLFAIKPVWYALLSVISSVYMFAIVLYLGNHILPFSFYLNHIFFLIVVIAVEYRNYMSIKQQYSLNKQLEEWAEIDALTGISNRRALDNYVESLRRDKSSFTFALLDVDNFKGINDAYGHKVGDKCLIDIARTLKDIFGDTVYRYGGDEFAVISFDNKERVYESMNYVNQVLGSTHKEYLLQICAGLYYETGNEHEYRTFENADKALYDAKQNGKARAVIYKE